MPETNRFLRESLLKIWDFFHGWEITSFHEWSVAERVERRWISLTSGRNPRSSIRTSASTCFFRFNLKTKHVDFILSFACQCHVYYTKYYNATCSALNKRNKHSKFFLPFWCVFYVRQAIKTAARDLVLHGIVSLSNRPHKILQRHMQCSKYTLF
jgi:hypothetical protein